MSPRLLDAGEKLLRRSGVCPKLATFTTAVDRAGTPPLEIRKHLGTMGMGGPEALQKMGTLSGGQKSRIAFAQIMWQKPHVLLLDEPTNHLDLDAVEALIHALLDFKGGLLVISHDEHLVSSICGELWVAEPGRVAVYKDSFENWRERERKRGPTTGPGAAKVLATRKAKA